MGHFRSLFGHFRHCFIECNASWFKSQFVIVSDSKHLMNDKEYIIKQARAKTF